MSFYLISAFPDITNWLQSHSTTISPTADLLTVINFMISVACSVYNGSSMTQVAHRRTTQTNVITQKTQTKTFIILNTMFGLVMPAISITLAFLYPSWISITVGLASAWLLACTLALWFIVGRTIRELDAVDAEFALKPGELVRFLSGSLPLTILSVNDETITCGWFADPTGTFHQQDIPAFMLVRLDPGESPGSGDKIIQFLE